MSVERLLEIGKLLRGLFMMAESVSPQGWVKHHPVFLKLAAAWIDAFRKTSSHLERAPDSWGELRDMEWMFHDVAKPIISDPDEKPEIALVVAEEVDLSIVKEIGKVWTPLWIRSFPFLENPPMAQAPDGPVGPRGWRHRGQEFHELNGGFAIEVMIIMADKHNGFKIPITEDSPKKLAQRIRENCKAIGLPWTVSVNGNNLVRIKQEPKEVPAMGPTEPK